MRRALVSLGLIVLALGLLSAPTSAQEDDPPPRFEGQLEVESGPAQDVRIVVTEVGGETDDGEQDPFVAETVSNAEGAWEISLPDRRGTYTVELDVSTLPEGVALDADDAVRESSISQPGQVRVINFALGGQDFGGSSSFEQVAQATVNGVKLGLIVAMCSVGLSMIFGTTGLINFSHGELVTFGAALAWWLNTGSIEAGLIAAAALAVMGGCLLGGVIEKGIMGPLRRRRLGSFQFVVVTIGMSLVGRQLLQLWIGEGNLTYRQFQIQAPWELGPIDITPRDLTIIAVSTIALIGVATVLQLTRLGKGMRAVSDNADLAASSGIAVNRVILSVWVSGAGLAALGGIFLGLSETVKFDMGFRLLLLIFAAVVLGGLGTAYGAMVGGLVIGIVTEVSTVWFEPELKFLWALLVLILVLLVRPQGILGTRERVG